MTSSQDIQDKTRSLLRSNLDDPNTRRSERGKNWIFTDYPRFDTTKPRIGIVHVSGQMDGRDINSNDREQRLRIDCVIFTDTNNAYDIDGDGEDEKASAQASYIADKIIDIVKNNQDEYRALDGVDHVVSVNESTNPRNDDLHQRNVELRAKLAR